MSNQHTMRSDIAVEEAAMRLGWVAVLGLVVGSVGRASPQDVRYETGFGQGSSRRKFDKAAERQHRVDWMQAPYEGPGSQVRITFDPRNCDVTLMTQRSFGSDRLLARARSVARRIGLPRADYIAWSGRGTTSTDIEMNKYLSIAHNRTTISLPLGDLATALAQSDLPQPIVIGIEADDADRVEIVSASGTTEIEHYWFGRPREVPEHAVLNLDVAIPWYAYGALVLFGLLFLAPLVALPVAHLRKRRTCVAPASPKSVPTPDEVQKRYDRGLPQWAMGLGFPVAMMLVFVVPALGVLPRGIGRGIYLLPLGSPTSMLAMAVLLPLVLVLPVALARHVQRKRWAREPSGTVSGPAPAGVRPGAAFAVLFIPFLILQVAFLVLVLPGGSPASLAYRRPLGLGMLAVAAIAFQFMMRRVLAMSTTVLEAGPWFDLVHDMARTAGVRVRKVALSQFPLPNASASVFGTITLTTALVEKLEKEEVRAVVAHEVGHLKWRHPQVLFVLSLVALSLFWAGAMRGTDLLPENLRPALGNPILLGILINFPMLLALGPLRRRRECEADRCAVDWVGDPELVIRALTKVHMMALQPHRLKPSDEALGTHPSLANRARAIREHAANQGLRAEEG